MNEILQGIIISLIIKVTIAADLPKSTHQQLTWNNAFKQCGGRFAGSKLFNNCQPDNCNVSSAGRMLQQQQVGIQQYWINGYTLRSPVYVYTGCFSVTITVDEFHRGAFNLTNNAPLECFRKCKDANRIYLNADTCLCVPDNKYRTYSAHINTEPTRECDEFCTGSNKETCGGSINMQPYKLLYSVYEQLIGVTIASQPVSQTCAVVNTDSRLEYRFCGEKLKYICESHDNSVGADCNNDRSTWQKARWNCQYSGQYLWPRTENKALKCMIESEMYWIGQHSEEKIVWGNDSLPSDALCLQLHIDNGTYSLQPESCSAKMYALCYNDAVNTDSDKGTTKTVFLNTVQSESTEMTRPSKSSRYDEKADSILVPVVIGATVGIVMIVATVLIILYIKRRRKRKEKKSTTVPKRSDYYSEPQNLNGESTERRQLVNTTDEGVYNHLGDTEVNLTSTGAVYDVMGRQENDYDIGNANMERLQKQENDLYDESRDIDTGLYNTSNEKNNITRPESSMYNVVDVH